MEDPVPTGAEQGWYGEARGGATNISHSNMFQVTQEGRTRYRDQLTVDRSHSQGRWQALERVPTLTPGKARDRGTGVIKVVSQMVDVGCGHTLDVMQLFKGEFMKDMRIGTSESAVPMEFASQTGQAEGESKSWAQQRQ
ncbi:hypothetical protein NDU88_002643 [Pleurodeles waltl]|uniref:Uncharacterized protein n=1 Tax=Pleurodeles waltl TaxID=8319 RepID=A0AAV7W3E2_PLEWA|nr:hypothetical protein NDU88_002643 [Pleurodeles waltl]